MFSQSSTSTIINYGTMTRADKLTADELADIAKSRAAVDKAQADLLATQSKIAASHKMLKESWMEWSAWYEFDGEFIVQRGQSHMATQMTFNSR